MKLLNIIHKSSVKSEGEEAFVKIKMAFDERLPIVLDGIEYAITKIEFEEDICTLKLLPVKKHFVLVE